MKGERQQEEALLEKINNLDSNNITHHLYKVIEEKGHAAARKEYHLKFSHWEKHISKKNKSSKKKKSCDESMKNCDELMKNAKIFVSKNGTVRVKINKEIFEHIVGDRGSLTKNQIKILHLKPPFPSNWRKYLVNKKITRAKLKRILKDDATKSKLKVSKKIKKPKLNKSKDVNTLNREVNKEVKRVKDQDERLGKIMSSEALKVYIHLERMEVEFKIEKFFNDCVNPKTNMRLPFDFYLPGHNILIEYDGRQHFEYIKKYHGRNREKGLKLLKEQQYRDSVKDDYCKKKGIKLIRISYKEKGNIKEILESKIMQ